MSGARLALPRLPAEWMPVLSEAQVAAAIAERAALPGTPPDLVESAMAIRYDDEVDVWIKATIARFKERGMTSMRFTYVPEQERVYLEGWKVRPDKESPPPSAASAGQKHE